MPAKQNKFISEVLFWILPVVETILFNRKRKSIIIDTKQLLLLSVKLPQLKSYTMVFMGTWLGLIQKHVHNCFYLILKLEL